MRQTFDGIGGGESPDDRAEVVAMSEMEPLDIHATRVRAWWFQLVAGQLDHVHPVHGSDLEVRVDDGVLVLRGRLRSEADLRRLLTEAEEFRDHGISQVRSEVEIVESDEVRGVLLQTLMSAFENLDQATFALDCLAGHAHLAAEWASTFTLETAPEALRALPEAYHEEVSSALEEGRALLVCTLDETDVFTARELIEQGTRSLWTVALPPEPRPVAPAS